MKILITEKQKNLLMEDQMRNYLIDIIKYEEWENAVELVGSIENLMKLTGIETSEDFLNLFNDLEEHQSKELLDFILYRYEIKNNVFIYDKKNGYSYISYLKIWSFLESAFGLEYGEIQELTKEWLSETYNLRVTTTDRPQHGRYQELSETYNLRVTTTINKLKKII